MPNKKPPVTPEVRAYFSAIGKRQKGVPKPFSKEYRAELRDRLAKVRAKRWPAKKKTTAGQTKEHRPRKSQVSGLKSQVSP